MKRIALILPLAIAACVPAQPIVSDYNGDSVTIQSSQFANRDQALAAAKEEAGRICAKNGRRAEYASTRVVAEYTNGDLFLCL